MKKYLFIISISLILVLIIDFFVGSKLLMLVTKKIDHTTSHTIFDHNLKKGFKNNLEWETGKKYTFCTDQNSFRTFCNNIKTDTKQFDIAFIGDSFTEGVGLEYENTFVGKITRNLNDLKIANLGVVSYSPSIYFAKLNYLIEKGYTFERVVIYFDISDVYDDNKKYQFKGGKIIRKKSALLSKLQKSLKSALPFLAYSTKKIKEEFIMKISKNNKVVKSCNYLDFCHEKSSWTFNNDYFGSNEINKSLKFMDMTYDILSKNNIKMSVGIYPWPSQIMHDKENSKVVKLFEEFCLNKCEFFFNNFPLFFKEIKTTDRKSVVKKYYMKNDVHFNSLGNEKLFLNFIETFKY